MIAIRPGLKSAAPLAYLALAWLCEAVPVNAYLFHLGILGRIGMLLHSALLLVLLAVCLLPFTTRPMRRLPLKWSRFLLALLLSQVHCALLLFYAILVLGCTGMNFMPTPQMVAGYARPILVSVSAPTGAHLLGAAFAACLWLGLTFTYYAAGGVLLKALRETMPESRSLLTYRPAFAILGVFACLYALTYDYWLGHEPVHMFLSEQGGALKMIPRGLINFPRGSIPFGGDLIPANNARIRPRPLVLITIDALRSDQMEVYGSPYADTPFLSKLYRDGKLKRVDQAYSVCTFSFCGMLGIFSSSYWHQLTGSSLVLTDALTHYGYQCRLFYSGDHTHFLGLRQYFGSRVAEFHDGSAVDNASMNDDRIVMPWLKQMVWNPGQPTFLGIHLMSVHVLGDRQRAFERWSPSALSPASMLTDHPDPDAYRNHYHNGILQADDEVRQIFELLRQKGVLDTALVIISADHGEYLGEFGRFVHGREPYEPVVRIPLLIYDQSGADYPSRALTSQVDIAPTFLYAIGAPVPTEWSGTPLQAATDRRAVAIASIEVSGIVGLSDGQPYKYWRRREDGAESLFPLTVPADEQVNVAGDPRSAGVLREMRDLYSQLASQRNADRAP